MSAYTTVIGLEVHVQLATQTKLFCGCSTRFGAEPNTQTCPVCSGLPGTLPVMNRHAYELGVRTALALNCTIAPSTIWDRRHYYPDLPKGYQTSQFDRPFSSGGWLEISDPKGRIQSKRIGLQRAHLEEDAGKSMHDENAGEADSRIDLNRTGTPLLEIVTAPNLRSALEAKIFLEELKLLLLYLGVSDCNMQEGSLRVDANVNLHIQEQNAPIIETPIVEIKNLNSFRAVERAIEFEAERQYGEWQETKKKLGDVPKQTRGWDDTANVTRAQRHKEESSDYRYFPEPDLVPVRPDPAWVDQMRAALGELPAALRARLETAYGITPYDSDVLVNQGQAIVDYFVTLADGCGDGKVASNWVQQDVLRMLKELNVTIDKFPVSAATLAVLLKKVKAGELDTARGRQVLAQMIESGQGVDAAMQALGIEKVDESALVDLCRELLAANPQTIADVKAGKLQAVGAIVGQAKKRNSNVNPGRVREICLELIAGM